MSAVARLDHVVSFCEAENARFFVWEQRRIVVATPKQIIVGGFFRPCLIIHLEL